MRKNLLLAGIGVALALPSQAAVLTVGTEIGVDFSDAQGGTVTNWNTVDVASGTIGAGSLTDISGTTVDGVSFTWSIVFANSFINNNASEDNSDFPVQPSFIPNNALGDWLGGRDVNLDDGGVSITLTLSGLSNSLSYDITVGASNDIANDNADTTWSIDGGSAQSTNAQVAAESYLTFTGVTTGGDGTLVLTAVPDASGTGIGPELAFVSALHLEAVPEPSSAALLGLGAFGLLVRRKRR